MKYMMLTVKILLFFATVFLLYLVGVILLAQFTRFQPDEVSEVTELVGTSGDGQVPGDTLTLYSWNIGYAGLGKESDFFYDGGREVRTEQRWVEKNFKGIVQQILTWQDADFILLQEVDWKARRSYGIMQAESIAKAMKERGFVSAAFSKNYDVKLVPMPITQPMGAVQSGLLTLSKYVPEKHVRVSFPGNFPWPKGLFFLNRCFDVARYPFKGKELVIINTHNSAFDGGTLKKQEMDYFKKFLLKEHQAGNYVIAGGDWNQIPPGFISDPAAGYEEMPVPERFPAEGWKWIADLQHRSNRKVDTPYIKGSTYTTILDFFLVSPNIEVLEIKGTDLGFEYSDHQPVQLRVKLN